jgi:hypothetical protein
MALFPVKCIQKWNKVHKNLQNLSLHAEHELFQFMIKKIFFTMELLGKIWNAKSFLIFNKLILQIVMHLGTTNILDFGSKHNQW